MLKAPEDSVMEKKVKNKVNKNYTEKNIIISYSALEQGKNSIMGIGRCLFIFLGIFPILPIIMNLYSKYAKYIKSDIYRWVLVVFGFVETAILLLYLFKWVKAVLTVYLINEEGEIYRLKISTFWYKIKDKSYLLNPMGTRVGKMSAIFYMIGNIKTVLDSVADEITYEEFISIGKMEKISQISEVKDLKKKVVFNAQIKDKSGQHMEKISIPKMYEKIESFVKFIQDMEKGKKAGLKDFGTEECNAENFEFIKKKSKSEKFTGFTIKWTAIMLWMLALTNLYRNAAIIWAGVEFVYIVMIGTDIIIEKIKKEKK